MKRFILSLMFVCFTSLSQASVVLNSGETYSGAFNLQSNGDLFKLTDNFWEVGLVIIDSTNRPFSGAGSIPGTVTLTLFENTDGTSQVFSMTQDSSNWLADYGLYFWGDAPLFTDHDGSFSISYNGGGTAELSTILISNFSGTLAPSNVAYANITPQAVSAVPLPAAAWLFLSGLGALGLVRRKRK